MTYVDQIKPATPSDLRDVMRSEDPMRIVQQMLSELAKLREFVDAEVAKWQGVKGTLELFAPAPPEPLEPAPASVTPMNGSGIPSADAQRTEKAPARFTIPAQRRRTMIELLSNEPWRQWRTGELATKVQQVEPGAGDMRNLVSRALTVLESEGLVVRIKKGTVRWSGDQQQLGGEP